jgi:hypothetical protein
MLSTYFSLDFNSFLLYIKTNVAFQVFLYMYKPLTTLRTFYETQQCKDSKLYQKFITRAKCTAQGIFSVQCCADRQAQRGDLPFAFCTYFPVHRLKQGIFLRHIQSLDTFYMADFSQFCENRSVIKDDNRTAASTPQ